MSNSDDERTAKEWRLWPLSEIEQQLAGRWARDADATKAKNDENRESRAAARQMRAVLRPRYSSDVGRGGPPKNRRE